MRANFGISVFLLLFLMQLIGTLLAAGLAAAGGQFTITAAYSCAPAKEISVYDYSQIDHIRSRTRILCIRSDSGSVKLDWLRSHLCNGSRYVFLQ